MKDGSRLLNRKKSVSIEIIIHNLNNFSNANQI